MLISKNQSLLKSISVFIVIMAVLSVATISVSGVAVAQVDSKNNDDAEEISTIITQIIDFIIDSASQLTEQFNEPIESDEEASNEGESGGEQTTEEATDEEESGEKETTENEEDSKEDQTTDEEKSGEKETTENEEDSKEEQTTEEVPDGEGSDDIKDDSKETKSNEEPTLQEVSLETNDVSDGTELQLTVTAESDTTVDWLSISLEGPNGNIRGGGSTYDFTEVESGVWETEYTYTVSDEAASGEYYFNRVQVENKANLQSGPWPDELSTTIDTGVDPEPPTLQGVSLETNNVGDGTELQLTVTAESDTTVDWLSISLEGPNGNIRGGGSGYDFTEIEDGIWETKYTYTVSDEAASGEYYFDRVQVENKANLQSDPWPDELSTTIDTGVDPEPPTLQEVSLETDNVNDGTELQLTVTAKSDTTVDWLSISLEGPNGNIRGGGSTYDFTEVEDGVWKTEYTYTVSDEAASGEYYFNRVQVENKANLQSDPWPDELSTTINNT